jgi:glyoxylase-like metal-dependent hydrolase (beta-lactamase superfamily II)
MTVKAPLRIPLGIACSYLLPADAGYVLVDTGGRGYEQRFFAVLARHAIAPRQITLIVLTHAHFDHAGGCRAIRDRCGAPVIVHRAEAALLVAGRAVIPRGTHPHSRICSALARRAPWAFRFAPCVPDHVVHEDTSLANFGLAARLVHTPGHSPGSLTVLLESGAAYVGDLCYNAFPLGLGPIVPVYADDLPGVYASWRRLLAMGVRTIYPAHGRPLTAAALRAKLAAVARLPRADG